MGESRSFHGGKYHGSFFLADVTGDGRDDLIETGSIYKATAGGGERNVGLGVDVFAVTDKPVPVPTHPPINRPAPQPGGYRAVRVYNCHPDQHRLSFWSIDNTTDAVNQTGPIDAMYSEAGFCPDPQDTPENFALVNGHLQTIIAIDPLAIGCEGRNDPSIAGCVNQSATFRGNASGPTCNWILSFQVVSCAALIGTTSSGLSVQRPERPVGTCVAGYVWREARPRDHVCVTPAVRSETATENALASSRRSQSGGAYGPNTCLVGFVWREAYADDIVCVPPKRRTRASRDNVAAAERIAP